VQDLALGHQLGQGADGVLDGRVRVDPVLVVEVDAVGAQPLQGPLDRGPDVRRALPTIADQDRPPRRFIAGVDAIAQAEQQVAQFQEEIDPLRGLSSSLALDEVETAAAAS